MSFLVLLPLAKEESLSLTFKYEDKLISITKEAFVKCYIYNAHIYLLTVLYPEIKEQRNLNFERVC